MKTWELLRTLFMAAASVGTLSIAASATAFAGTVQQTHGLTNHMSGTVNTHSAHPNFIFLPPFPDEDE
ncbi:hypothetical protein [Alicyclobacillus vulcanalis]|uniref:Uncharacterized protein n=1 Tax=Alicyclobacillus vulcanalis TaxID=252246 RepID=A0A1N7LGK3_9BACL|nr:hypothetical protein [Alicyclobacillus vulcanalis]SIS72906.1 hypothetical protein SAMN05421799_103127 [Alicyclobacillus vulcanalis]